MKGFSIIIVTWNALELLKEFLPSVAESDYPDFEIIIANNASTDGSSEWIRSAFPEIKIATFDQNYGYCGGNNRAVSFASKEILIFLNNDVKVSKNWLHALNESFGDDKIAAVQPKIRSYLQPDYFEYAGAAGGFMDKFGYPFCRGRIFDEVEIDNGQYDDAREIFWASGAALAIRKDVFLKKGGFDEDFEFHMEEIDLCWRLQNQGQVISYNPDSVVFHLGGGSLPMGSPRKIYYNFRNSLFMLWKNYSTASVLTHFPLRILLDMIAALRSLLSGNLKEFAAIVRAYRDFIRQFGSVNKKRRKLQQQRSIADNPKTMLQANIVFSYFLKKKQKFSELVEQPQNQSLK